MKWTGSNGNRDTGGAAQGLTTISINNNVTLESLKITISFYCFYDIGHFAGNLCFAPDQAINHRK